MLQDTLLQWCQEKYDQPSAEYCCLNCDNKENCNHSCDNCLNQVHWYPRYGGRSDYTCPNLLLRYVVRFTEKYSQQIHNALEFIDISQYPYFNIFSIGCGATPDLMVFEEVAGNKNIYYKGYDRNPLWKDIHDRIKTYTETTDNITVKLRCEDIFDVLLDGRPAHKHYNVVVVQYLLSHLYNTKQECQTLTLFQKIIDNIISKRSQDSPFLIIITDVDSCNKGRNRWYNFLDKLEDAGFCGNAYARSAFPNGDLGAERWTNYYHAQSPSFQKISYQYVQNQSDHDGAQLVIELR